MFGADYRDIKSMINTLEDYLPADLSLNIFSIGNDRRSDWKRFWNYAKQIQEKFNSGVKFPSKEERQIAWTKFNSLRNEASRRSEIEKTHIESSSKELRDEIFSICSDTKYVPVYDVLFFFDKANTWQVKKWQEYVRKAGQKLSDNKHKMLGRHKQECWELIQEIRESHQLFWDKHNEAWEERKRNNESKKQEFIDRINRNIVKNKHNLEKANDALERQESRLSDLQYKLSDTESDKWRGIFSEWISECEDKIYDIKNSIERISGWIDEDEEKLRNAY